VAPGHWSDVMGGAQYQTLLLVRALAAAGGFQVSYLTKHADPKYHADDHEIVRIENPWNRTRSLFLDAVPVSRALREIAPDVIYYREAPGWGGIIAHYAREAGIRAVWHISSDADVTPFRFRLSKDLPLRFIDKKLLEYGARHTDTIVAQTTDQARLLEKNYGRRASKVIYNFHPAPQENIRKGLPVEVVWVGNLKSLKQPEVFIRAAAELRGQTDARFIMIGAMQASGRYERELRAAIDATPNLTWLGKRTQDEANAAIASASILVNTSLWEGFSNTFIQAWARRVPVVSLNVNPDGLLSGGKLGFHSGNPKQMNADILRLITDAKLRDEMGLQSQGYAMEHHSLANTVTLIDLLTGRGAGKSPQSPGG
jgi:glycosyltransferase involved in cell wall biosynthesis